MTSPTNQNPWITYTVVTQSGTTFTHFTKLGNLDEAQAEWEQEFNQKATSIMLDAYDSEPDFSDWFEDDDSEPDFSDWLEVVPQVEYHVSELIEDRAWYEDFLAEVQKMNEETEA